jgi:hypothetical protein
MNPMFWEFAGIPGRVEGRFYPALPHQTVGFRGFRGHNTIFLSLLGQEAGMTGAKRLIQSIRLQNYLPFGPEAEESELKSLNTPGGPRESKGWKELWRKAYETFEG